MKRLNAAALIPMMLTLGLSAGAPTRAAAEEGTPPVPGSARDWVELQISGRAASPVERPLPGEMADRSYQRYVDTFSKPIPDTLAREGFLSEGGGK